MTIKPTTPDTALLRMAAELAIDYVAEIDARAVAPSAAALDRLAAFDEPLTAAGRPAEETIRLLAEVGGPATTATTGPRYFGFVNGATLPVALAASVLANAWDQNAALPVMSPVSAALHDVVRRWLVEVLGLPAATEVGFVTGATVANAAGLAAARDALLAAEGWDAQADGLFGAPPITVVVGAKAHSTLHKSLGLVGLGRQRVSVVEADDQGRIRPERLPAVSGPVLLCAQAGEVNTGAFDPFEPLADWVAERNGWLHVDGAFGLWALADPTRAQLVQGLVRADSLATDAHKWLNVTYDCGLVFVRHDGALRRTFASIAGYLPPEHGFEAMHHTPQSSQRARQIEVWAALRTLGRDGLAELVQRACTVARAIAARLAEHGFSVCNDVVLNQVLLRPPDPKATNALVAAVQRDGRIWCGPTTWQGTPAIRVSVSSWKTTEADGVAAADVLAECAQRVSAR